MTNPPLKTPSIWDSTMEEALIRILLHSNQAKLRVRAAQELAKNPSPAAVDALTYVSLLSSSDETREAARMGLDLVYGEDAERVIAEYRESHDLEEEELESEEEDEIEFEESESPSPFPQSEYRQTRKPMSTPAHQDPVIEKVNSPAMFLIIGTVLILVMAGLAVLLYFMSKIGY